MAQTKIYADEIASNDGRVTVNDVAGYGVSRPLEDLTLYDFVTKEHLSGGGANLTSITKVAGTPFPLIVTNGVDFNTVLLRPIVWITISLDAVTDTTEAINPLIIDYTYTDATKTALLSITIRDNGMGTLPADAVVTVVG